MRSYAPCLICQAFMSSATISDPFINRPRLCLWRKIKDRALVLRDYVWTLYEQQEVVLRDLFPVPRARKLQSYDKMELSNGGMIVALPGKDPDKVRSEHPTLIVFDEACFIEQGGCAAKKQSARLGPFSSATLCFLTSTLSSIPNRCTPVRTCYRETHETQQRCRAFQ
jgi:hypothetical protein